MSISTFMIVALTVTATAMASELSCPTGNIMAPGIGCVKVYALGESGCEDAPGLYGSPWNFNAACVSNVCVCANGVSAVNGQCGVPPPVAQCTAKEVLVYGKCLPMIPAGGIICYQDIQCQGGSTCGPTNGPSGGPSIGPPSQCQCAAGMSIINGECKTSSVQTTAAPCTAQQVFAFGLCMPLIPIGGSGCYGTNVQCQGGSTCGQSTLAPPEGIYLQTQCLCAPGTSLINGVCQNSTPATTAAPPTTTAAPCGANQIAAPSGFCLPTVPAGGSDCFLNIQCQGGSTCVAVESDPHYLSPGQCQCGAGMSVINGKCQKS